ncbi:MAG TPA: hypothetical protein VHF01_09185 [Candidatus Acidoferrum sp.]|nr:hypothetical protein [Candidatus Acidoferrum sp.]
MRRYVLPFLVLGAFLSSLLTATDALAQRVVKRERLGNNTEDITFVTSGPFANKIAILDGYEVFGVDVEESEELEGAARKLFDLRDLGIIGMPQGIVFIRPEGMFAVNDSVQPTTLFLKDKFGNPSGTRNINFLNGFIPDHVEGLDYIPSTAGIFPDHLLEVVAVFSPQLQSRIEVLQRDGQVVSEIIPAQPVSSPAWPSRHPTVS